MRWCNTNTSRLWSPVEHVSALGEVFDGSLVQWEVQSVAVRRVLWGLEAGPNRFLDLSCLLERMVNYVDDLTFDVNDNAWPQWCDTSIVTRSRDEVGWALI